MSPSLKSRHIAWLVKYCVNHRKAVGKSKRAIKAPVRLFAALRVIIFLQKFTAIVLALIFLICISPLIYIRLQKLPPPELKGAHKLKNGVPVTKLLFDAEMNLAELKISQFLCSAIKTDEYFQCYCFGGVHP